MVFREKEKISITLMFSDEALYKINKGSKRHSKPISYKAKEKSSVNMSKMSMHCFLHQHNVKSFHTYATFTIDDQAYEY